MRKIAFFDLDGTLSSEIDHTIPQSTIDSIRKARANGNLMFINTGRCFENVEPQFRDIGWDGYICGCGTHIICDGKNLLYKTLTRDVINQIAEAARKCNLDIRFESKDCICYDLPEKLRHPMAKKSYAWHSKEKHTMPKDIYDPSFTADKFGVWLTEDSDLEEFLKTSDNYFDCIDRYPAFKEFVPHGFSKATGIQVILDYYGISKENTYAFGDSNNDLPMLTFVANSIAMGNSNPPSLFEKVTYRTENASENGIHDALEHFGFI